jgi:hypothetical protein
VAGAIAPPPGAKCRRAGFLYCTSRRRRRGSHKATALAAGDGAAIGLPKVGRFASSSIGRARRRALQAGRGDKPHDSTEGLRPPARSAGTSSCQRSRRRSRSTRTSTADLRSEGHGPHGDVPAPEARRAQAAGFLRSRLRRRLRLARLRRGDDVDARAKRAETIKGKADRPAHGYPGHRAFAVLADRQGRSSRSFKGSM